MAEAAATGIVTHPVTLANVSLLAAGRGDHYVTLWPESNAFRTR